jgi:tRNA G18 (ribose-2'-O)-methylase SpoU
MKSSPRMMIVGETRVKEALDAHPQLRELLVEINPKFRKINNKAVFNTVARWARFNDVARLGGCPSASCSIRSMPPSGWRGSF